MEFCEGRILAGSLKFRPVKHGGDTEEGAPRARPTKREFLLTFAGTRDGKWSVKDAIAEADRYGFSKGAIYTGHAALVVEKTFKRVSPGEYVLSAKAGGKAKAVPPHSRPKKQLGRKTSRRIKPPGTTMMDKVLIALKGVQNGSGEGVGIGDIRKAMQTTKNISPYLRDLVADKQATRVAPGKYRAIAQ
ncbi:hypothetical protein EHM76_00245 [bacterium]|nr:MAG: hypothetical protein EHM76_00245 [bacterium]